jgi:uncharacterized membrane protein YgaE (UPF0421/DUF939 family)
MAVGSPKPPDLPGPEAPAVAVAVRQATDFDRASVSWSAGLLAAIPVVAVLGGAIAAGVPVAGVTMGAGAMLVGMAWRVGGGRPPLALMATDAVVMSVSTFVGSITGTLPALHLGLICVWALMAGLLFSLGNRGAVVGNQAMIAVIVFGRFGQPPLAALGLAGLVLAGGAAQVVFLYFVRWPTRLRVQRTATAVAYRRLSEMAVTSSEISGLPAATALDGALATLSSPTLFGDAALLTLRSLVDEGLRIRVQLSAVHALVRQQRAATLADERSQRAVELALEQIAAALALAADAIEGDARSAAALPPRVAALGQTLSDPGLADLDPPTASHQPEASGRLAGSAALHMSRRLVALAGQLRAVSSLAPSAGEAGGLRGRRPRQRTNRPLQRARSDLAMVRANVSLNSPAGRHALRLTVVVLIAELISRQLPLQRSYWMVVAAVTVLRPEFGATFTRGAERALGTVLGVGLAGLLTAVLHPAGGVTVVIVGLLAWAGYAMFPASFAVGYGFITGVVVFLINVVSPDTLSAAGARLVDTLVGGALGLLAYALWPTWSKLPARQALANVVGAQRAYLHRILATVIDGRRAEEDELRPLSRRARLARTNAESTVANSLSEPATRRIDAEQSQSALAALRRLVQAAHVLRLDAEDDRPRSALPTLAPLARDLDRMLEVIDTAVQAEPQDVAVGRPAAVPDLRASYLAFARTSSHDSEGAALLAELDEIVDAANGLAELVGLDPVDSETEPAATRRGG